MVKIQSAQVVVINADTNEVLGVSRKNDHNDFGLCGGKLDPNESIIDAAVREMQEETNIVRLPEELELIYSDDRGATYLTYYDPLRDVIISLENAVVKWCSCQCLIDGSFGKYNENIFKILKMI